MKNKRILYLTMIGCSLGILLALVIFWKEQDFYRKTSYEGMGVPVESPSADLSIENVLQVQLQALQNNDENDKGIDKAFEFASPQNKEATGPVEHFRGMLHSEQYQRLLNFRSFTCLSIIKGYHHATAMIELEDSERKIRYYRFEFSRQLTVPFLDCWMVDAVLELEVPKEGVTV